MTTRVVLYRNQEHMETSPATDNRESRKEFSIEKFIMHADQKCHLEHYPI